MPGPAFDHAAAVDHLRNADERLRRLIDAVGPFELRVQTAPTTFAALSEAIVYQQLTAKAAATIYGRVLAMFPGSAKGLSPEPVLAASEEDLRAAGLSRQKAASLRDLAMRSVEGVVPTLRQARRMSDGEIVERLTAVRGVGRWTAEMFLIFRLGRPDVLPVGDLGVQKGFQRMFRLRDLPRADRLEKLARPFKPYRSIACWYMWRLAEEKVAPAKKPAAKKR